jgi:hypothetical protein
MAIFLISQLLNQFQNREYIDIKGGNGLFRHSDNCRLQGQSYALNNLSNLILLKLINNYENALISKSSKYEIISLIV